MTTSPELDINVIIQEVRELLLGSDIPTWKGIGHIWGISGATALSTKSQKISISGVKPVVFIRLIKRITPHKTPIIALILQKMPELALFSTQLKRG
jgi:hypothetical protein